MFYLIGIGLGDAKDITVRGLEIVKRAESVYLESYTSILSVGKDELEKFYGRELIIADREMVEQNSEDIFKNADVSDVVLLVVGDPFGATTHLDIIIRAKQKGIPFQVVHNASILNAIGCCGLQLYSFGETVSIPYWTDTWQPDSFYDKIFENRKRGLHTLCLLDIKVKEPTLESLMKRKREYEPPRFMSVSEAADQLLQILLKKADDGELAYKESTLCVGVARVGSPTQQIVACSLKEMKEVDLGKPLHSLVITGGKLHPLEEEYLETFTAYKSNDENAGK
ncbi:hypothetical protein J437_LFUL015030 [Ladona fulva]|uniref:diphthine methyl ester synthase n=1 Tax=Ladona fulva TaxID=123851 RepID=A0A8K0KGJ1_LADFU|nr:hypothetical protein J437_LFUL015030 [Ladona fulva]